MQNLTVWLEQNGKKCSSKELINLTQLYLYNNKIVTIPNEIGQLINLTYLRLNNNKISTIPNAAGSLIVNNKLVFIFIG